MRGGHPGYYSFTARPHRKEGRIISHLQPFIVHEEDIESEDGKDLNLGPIRFRTLISADQNPSGRLTVGVAEIDPDPSRGMEIHRHTQPEIYYILEGKGIITITEEEYPVRRGTAVFIPGAAAHGTRNTGTDPLRFLYIFPADSFEKINYESPVDRDHADSGDKP